MPTKTRYMDPTKCDKCGESYTKKDMDGGRCLSCGTMICSTNEELHRKELGIKEFEEPERCDACGSTSPMNYEKVSVQSGTAPSREEMAWICDACGEVHLDRKKIK